FHVPPSAVEHGARGHDGDVEGRARLAQGNGTALRDRHAGKDLRSVGSEVVVEEVAGAAGDPPAGEGFPERGDGGVPGGRLGMAKTGDEERANAIEILLVAADVAGLV